MSFGFTGGRRSSGSGGSSKPLTVNGGSGIWSGGGGDVATARELIAGQGMEIDDPAARTGNPIFRVKPAIFEISRGQINGQSGVQPMVIFGDMDAVEITEVSFRLFSAQPTTMRGGLYFAPPVNGVSQVGAELVPDTMRYDDWRGGLFTKRMMAESQYRRPAAIWWVPSVVSPIPLSFEISVWGMPRWFTDTAALEKGISVA